MWWKKDFKNWKNLWRRISVKLVSVKWFQCLNLRKHALDDWTSSVCCGDIEFSRFQCLKLILLIPNSILIWSARERFSDRKSLSFDFATWKKPWGSINSWDPHAKLIYKMHSNSWSWLYQKSDWDDHTLWSGKIRIHQSSEIKRTFSFMQSLQSKLVIDNSKLISRKIGLFGRKRFYETEQFYKCNEQINSSPIS